MQVTVLGSGQDGGLPQFGAAADNDRRVRHHDLPTRMAPAVAVESGGVRLLLDTGPDLRHQWRWETAPDGVVLTHGHMGHYTGLVHFGQEAMAADCIPLRVTPSMAAFLGANQPWAALLDGGHLRVGMVPGPSIDLIPVPHRAEYTDTVAVSVEGRLLYLPDIDSWSEWKEAEAVIARHEVALLDATFFSREEVPGRNFDEVRHPLVADTVERFGRLGTRVILTHLNHTNPLCDLSSPESGWVRDRGVEVASDGMVVTLG